MSRTIPPSQSEKFKINLQGMIADTIDVIKECNDAQVSDCDTKALADIHKAIKLVKREKLMEKFINSHESWKLIANRDEENISNLLPSILEGTGLDASLMTKPLEIFKSLKEMDYKVEDPSESDSEDSYDEDDKHWPVSGKDIGIMWDFMESLVKIACNHIHFCRNPVYNGATFKYKSDRYSEVDLSFFCEKMNFTLTKSIK